MLHDHWFAASQIAKCAVADPRRLQLDIGRLGAAKLPARTLNIGVVHLSRAANLTSLPDSPTTILQIFPLLHIALLTQDQGQLQGLTSEPRQSSELQESHSFCVLVGFITVHNPVGGVPGRDRRESLAMRVEGIGPALQANRRPDRNPAWIVSRMLTPRASDTFGNSEIDVMIGHAELPTTNPKLQKAGINIHKRRTAEESQQRGADGIVEIQQQVSMSKDRLGFRTCHVDVLCRCLG